MNVDVTMILESTHQLPRVLERLLERVRVMPGEISLVSFRIPVAESVGEADFKVSISSGVPG